MKSIVSMHLVLSQQRQRVRSSHSPPVHGYTAHAQHLSITPSSKQLNQVYE